MKPHLSTPVTVNHRGVKIQLQTDGDRYRFFLDLKKEPEFGDNQTGTWKLTPRAAIEEAQLFINQFRYHAVSA